MAVVAEIRVCEQPLSLILLGGDRADDGGQVLGQVVSVVRFSGSLNGLLFAHRHCTVSLGGFGKIQKFKKISGNASAVLSAECYLV